MCRQLDTITYTGSRPLFLDKVHEALSANGITGQFLFRATEAEHLWKIFRFGTDRAGFPGKKVWPHSEGSQTIFHEDVIIGATREDLLKAPPDRPTLFTNFEIRSDPVLLVYDKTWFVRLKGHHYKFTTEKNRPRSVLAAIPVFSSIKAKEKTMMQQQPPDTDSLNLIVKNQGPLNLSVYVGNEEAMNNVNFVLVENEINAILNCAAELRFNNETCSEYFKVGFWDGYGNNTTTLAAAVYSLEQLLSIRHWPWVGYTPKNVLVNCHSGHSRSVTVMSMYLCQKHPNTWDWDSALAHVMEARKWPHPPTDGMRALAKLLLEEISNKYGSGATLFTILEPEISTPET